MSEKEIPGEAWEAAEEIAAAAGLSKRAGEIAARITEAMRRRDARIHPTLYDEFGMRRPR